MVDDETGLKVKFPGNDEVDRQWEVIKNILLAHLRKRREQKPIVQEETKDE